MNGASHASARRIQDVVSKKSKSRYAVAQALSSAADRGRATVARSEVRRAKARSLSPRLLILGRKLLAGLDPERRIRGQDTSVST
jgi:hypothetical protein